MVHRERPTSAQVSAAPPDGSDTLEQMILRHGDAQGNRTAVLAPGREPLTFAQLREHIQTTRQRLWELGVGRGEIVASVLPNGSDAATASLCITCCATVAPLNPALHQAEYETLFEELRPQIVLAHPDQAQEARRAAESFAIRVIEVMPEAEAGIFTLQGKTSRRRFRAGSNLLHLGSY